MKTSFITYETARRLGERGWAVVPTNSNGEKRPLGRFASAKSWRDFSERLPTDDELHQFFDTPRRGGIVLHRGQLVEDFDVKDAPPADGLCFEETDHGYHVFYRCRPDEKIGHDHEGKTDHLTFGSFVRLCDPSCLLDWPHDDLPLWAAPAVPAAPVAPAKLPSAVPTAKLPDSATDSATPAVPASKMEGATGAVSFRDGLLAQGWKSLGVKGDGREHFSRPGAAHPGQTDATLSPDGTAFKVFSTSAVGVAPPAEAMAVQPAAAFVAANPELNEPLWEQFARRGELFIVVGSSKVGKSLLATQLALSVAAGTPLLGRACRKGRALIVDLELPPAVLAYRLGVQAKAMGLDLAALGDGLLVSSQRCHVGGLDSLAATLGEAAANGGGFALVVVDGLYKWLDAEGIEENANAQVAGFMGRLGALCEQHGTALCLTHHRRKQNGGNGNGAACTADEAVGAGAFGRSVDSLHCLMQGKVPGQFELSSALRSFPGHKPLPVKRCGAIWSAA